MAPDTHVLVDLGGGAVLRVSGNQTAPRQFHTTDLMRKPLCVWPDLGHLRAGA